MGAGGRLERAGRDQGGVEAVFEQVEGVVSVESGYCNGNPAIRHPSYEQICTGQTGYAEVWYGAVDGPRITLVTDVVARTSTAKDYTAGQRMYGLVEGHLMYAYDMAAMGQALQPHLWARLVRQ